MPDDITPLAAAVVAEHIETGQAGEAMRELGCWLNDRGLLTPAILAWRDYQAQVLAGEDPLAPWEARLPGGCPTDCEHKPCGATGSRECRLED